MATQTYNLMNENVTVDPATGRVLNSTPSPQGATRSLQMQSGDPASLLASSQGQAQSVATSIPDSQKFGMALQDLLRQYQQLGTKSFTDQSFNAQQLQTSRISNPNLQGLIGAAPGQQQSVIGSGANAVTPTIRGANEGAQTFSEQLKSFGSAVDNAKDLVKEDQKTLSSNKLAGGYPFYKYPGSDQVFDSRTNKPITYEQYKQMGGVGIIGHGSFGDVKEVGGNTSNKLLSVAEAKSLGVPYGTTQAEAARMGITPTTKHKNGSSGNQKIPKLNSRGKIESLIRQTIADAGGINNQNRYELWGLVADEIDRQGYVTASSVNDLLWKAFHPEGVKGYQKYVLGQQPKTSSSSGAISNPFKK